ncbi:hypothetical protein ACQJBY_032070 [Aegilops geniculata]
MSSIIVPVYINAPELSTILENNAGLEYLTKTRKVCVRRLLSANAHGYPIPPPALEYMKQYHKAYFTDEAQEQLKAADPYVPSSAPAHEDDDQSHTSDDNGAERKKRKDLTESPTHQNLVCTSGISSVLQQTISKRPKFCLEEIHRTGHPEVDAKGKSVPSATHPGFPTEDELKLAGVSATPEEYQEFLKTMEMMYETYENPCYDAEGLALGSLKRSEYFLMPDTIPYEPCTVDSICRGPAFWKPDWKLVSQVYALAKAQALQLGIAGDRQIKWAVLRAQAFSAGWYHGQKYSRLCSPPKNSAEIYANDLGAIEKYLSDSWKLVCFLPFLHELAFRTVGSTWSWNSDNAAKYEGKARKFADSSSVGPALSYLTGKDLYGPALQWIGVEMPMKVLQRKVGRDAIPEVFALQCKAAPAGKALITTTHAVVKEMKTLDCWKSIQDMRKFNDTIVSVMAGKIQANPWKYHAMPKPYNLKPLSEEEQLEVAAAMTCAEDFAPITFAFTQSVMGHHQLPGYMALKKYASGALYERFKKFFAFMRKKLAKDIGAKVVAEASGIPRR